MRQNIKIKLYPLIDEAIEEALYAGIRDAYKHSNDEDRLSDHEIECVTECQHREIMRRLCDIIDFEGE